MANTQKYLNHLLQNTGITPACSEEERTAAELIAKTFSDHGFEPEVQEFSASGSSKIVKAVLGIVVFLGAVLMGIGGAVGVIGLLLTIACAVIYTLERQGKPVLSQLGRGGLSQNVIAYHKASGPLASPRNRPVVVVAHYDSPRADLLSQEPYASYRPLLVKLMPFAMVAPAVLAVVRLLPVPGAAKVVLWILAIVAALVPLANGVAILANRFVLPYTSGAVCNKSSVAAMLGVMDAVAPFQGHEEFPDDVPFEEYFAEERRVAEEAAAAAEAEAAAAAAAEEPLYPHEEAALAEDSEALELEEADEQAAVQQDTDAGVAGETAAFAVSDADDALSSTVSMDMTDVIDAAALAARAADAADDAGDAAAEQEPFEETAPMQEVPENVDQLIEEYGTGEDDLPPVPEDEELPLDTPAQPSLLNVAGNYRFGPEVIRSLNMLPDTCSLVYEPDELPRAAEPVAEQVAAPVDEYAADDAPANEVPEDAWYPEDDPVSYFEDDSEYDVAEGDEDAAYVGYEGYTDEDSAVDAAEDAPQPEYLEGDVNEAYDDEEALEGGSVFADDAFEEEPAAVAAPSTGETGLFSVDLDTVDEVISADYYEPSEDELAYVIPAIVDEDADDEDDDGQDDAAASVQDADEFEPFEDASSNQSADIEPDEDLAEQADDAADTTVSADRTAAVPAFSADAQPDAVDATQAVDLSAPADTDSGATQTFEQSGATADDPSHTIAMPARSVETVDSLMAEISSNVPTGMSAPKPQPRAINVPSTADAPVPHTPQTANRASLFDLPDPSDKPVDPFATDDAAAPAQTSDAAAAAARSSFTVVSPAGQQAAPVSAPSSVDSRIETISAPAPQQEKPRRGLGRLFGRKKKNDDSMSEWLGVDDDFDAKRSGGDIGSWDNFDDDDIWKGGAAGADGVTEAELREAVTSLGDDELLGHDIWFVAAGASENGNAGVKAFLREHRSKLRGVFLINLECVGAGQVAMLATEGEERVLKGDKRIMKLVSRVSADFHNEYGAVDMPYVTTDAHAAMSMSLRSLTLAGVEGSGFALGHTEEDQPYNVDPDQIAMVSDVVTEVIRRS